MSAALALAPIDSWSMRRFRGAAVHWIYRAARIPRGYVASPVALVNRIFTDVVTDDDTIEVLRAMPHPASAISRTPDGWTLYNIAPRDPSTWAWACGQLACSVLRSRFRTHIGSVIDDAREQHGSNARNKVEHELAHMIGAELLRMSAEKAEVSS